MELLDFTPESYLQELMGRRRTALVEFWAPWCVYCRRLELPMQQIAGEHGELLCGRVNVDELPEQAAELQIDTVPTLVLFRKGTAAARLVGPDSKAKIEAFLRENSGE